MSFFFRKITVYIIGGAPVAQWVKRWPTDLVVLSSITARGEIFLTVNGVPAHSLSLSAHRPDMTEILLKKTKKSQVIYLSFVPVFFLITREGRFSFSFFFPSSSFFLTS